MVYLRRIFIIEIKAVRVYYIKTKILGGFVVDYNKELVFEVNHQQIIQALFGRHDQFKKMIERETKVLLMPTDSGLKLNGDEKRVEAVEELISNLVVLIEQKKHLSKQDLNYQIQMMRENGHKDLTKQLDEILCVTYKGKPIKPKTMGQKQYIDRMHKNDIVFGIGPAGTGKTYLAVAKAISAFKKGEVNKIIITRPAVEAGENLGFLPGDLQDKIGPYLRPINDALYDILGPEALMGFQEKGAIEIAPLAYMRGRTLDAAYVILDEAQNTTKEQMKMFLTRLGYGSRAIITGDITQVDLPRGKKSGLIDALRILEGIKGIEISHFSKVDVVRHPLVQRVIEAYEISEKNQNKHEKKHNNRR
jgi:phosphate starvation-inducible PhoH-like protein